MARTLNSINPPATFVDGFRRALRAPLFPVLVLFHLAYLLIYAIPVRFGDVPAWAGIGLTALTHAVMVLVFYRWYGHLAHWLCARNVPLAVTLPGFFVLMPGLEWALGPLVYDVGWGGARLQWYSAQTIVLFPPTAVIWMLVHERRLRPALATPPEALPYWRPVKSDADLLRPLLPADIRAPILRLEAANQYVIVTTELGTHELRLTFQEALELMPEGAGVRIQRSTWLAASQLTEIVYRQGNPKVVAPDGTLWSASRARVPQIRAAMEAAPEAPA